MRASHRAPQDRQTQAATRAEWRATSCGPWTLAPGESSHSLARSGRSVARSLPPADALRRAQTGQPDPLARAFTEAVHLALQVGHIQPMRWPLWAVSSWGVWQLTPGVESHCAAMSGNTVARSLTPGCRTTGCQFLSTFPFSAHFLHPSACFRLATDARHLCPQCGQSHRICCLLCGLTWLGLTLLASGVGSHCAAMSGRRVAKSFTPGTTPRVLQLGQAAPCSRRRVRAW